MERGRFWPVGADSVREGGGAFVVNLANFSELDSILRAGHATIFLLRDNDNATTE